MNSTDNSNFYAPECEPKTGWTKRVLRDTNGTVRTEYFQCEYGLTQGTAKGYDKRGKLTSICTFKDNELHGEFKSFDEDGNLSMTCNYVNGCVNGLHIYFSNGIVKKQCWFSNGEEVDVSIHGIDINNVSDEEINLLKVIYG